MKRSTVTLFEVRFDKNKLAAMNSNERNLLFVLGHLLNDMMSIHRIVLCCGNYPVETKLLRVAGQCQCLVAIRLLIGLMHEVWKVVDRDILQSSLNQTYLSLIKERDPEAISALDALKAYFQGTPKERRTLTSIRNNYAFHYETHKWGLENWSKGDDDAFVFHVSKKRVNSFYGMSHELITRNMLSGISDKADEAFDKVIRETVEIAGWLIRFLHAALIAAVDRYDVDRSIETSNETEVPARNITTIFVPCFVRGKWKAGPS